MIELILRESVPSLGKPGDLVRVKPGYARNFLLPRGLAFEATEGNKKRIAAESKARATRDAAERAEAQAYATKLETVELSFTAKAGEDGKLFGSVTSADIAAALEAKGMTVDKRKIEIPTPIKSVGDHEATVKLRDDVTATITLQVVAAK